MPELRIEYSPRPWQRECHANRKRFSVYALHRRAGKTELALMELIKASMRCDRPLGQFLYLAPLLKQAEITVWRRLQQKLEPILRYNATAVQVSQGDLSVTWAHNGAQIRLCGANHPDTLRGPHLDGIVVDEVAQIDPRVWEEIIQPMLADRMGWALFIGTPHGVNLFSQLFYKAEQDPTWHSARYTVYQTNALDPKEVERQRAGMSETAFAREFLCDFAAAGDDQLIPLADVLVAAQRSYVERDVAEAPRIIGVDVARFGDDRSVIMRRQGLQAFDPLVYRGLDNMELAARVATQITTWEPQAVFVDAGAGAGVIDRLRQLGFNVLEVNFGGKATNPTQFARRRDEMWFAMREWLLAGGAIPDDQALKQELATPIYWLDPQQRKVLESKDDVKKRLEGSSSPDIADALALTFAAPVQKLSPIQQAAARTQRAPRDYDPLAHYERKRSGV